MPPIPDRFYKKTATKKPTTKPEPLKSPITPQKKLRCVACSGTGVNSRGNDCVACNGTGKKSYKCPHCLKIVIETQRETHDLLGGSVGGCQRIW
jgi:RecJ-like exonuclease